jgi:bacterioferritin (cytochrome b1)
MKADREITKLLNAQLTRELTAVNRIETQLELVEKVGLQNYLQWQMEGGSAS